jgi:hypothetical protein
MHKQEEIVSKLTKEFFAYVEAKSMSDLFEISRLSREVFDNISNELLQRQKADTAHISAPNAVLEVIDDESGQLYRRYLELEYDENNNGLRITGESISGESAQIAFLSEEAINKLAELKGDGPDKPKCKGH